MKTWKHALTRLGALSAIGTAILLAGCGGGGSSTATSNNPGFTSMVVFGDSLSDVGTYRVGLVAAIGGGTSTVNSPTSRLWTDAIAAQYNLPKPCAAQTGLLSILPGITAVPVQNFAACTNYAQGSARVTNPAGPRSFALQQGVIAAIKAGGGTDAQAAQAAIGADAGIGLMALPIVNQMANHLTAAGGSYSGKELVTVLAGANDTFLNSSGVSDAAAGGAGAVGAARFAGWPAGVQASVAAGGAAATGAAQQAAVAGMAQAANELIAAINAQVLGKGAKYVVVVNLPDVSQTPLTAPYDPATRGFVNLLVTTFNSTLNAGLAGKPGVVLVDAYTQSRDQFANPSQYGLSNVTTPVCSKTSPANPLAGASLGCTTASLIAGDTSRHFFADDVHPTPYAHQLLAQFVAKSLAVAGWL